MLQLHEAKRRSWFITNFVEPLQINFRRDFTEEQIVFWIREVTLVRMTRNEIVEVVGFLKSDCQFFPTVFDFHRLRPRRLKTPDLPPLQSGQTHGAVAQLAGSLATKMRGKMSERTGVVGSKSRTRDYVQHMKDIGKHHSFLPKTPGGTINTKPMGGGA